MKKTITEYDFTQGFVEMNREDNFSYAGLKALYSYFIQLEDDCDMDIEYDVIAICCEYTEYEDLEELHGSYPDIESIDDLRNHTQVIEIDSDSFIIQDY
ncbi:MAG: hypothetical protein GY710_06210 [Desulfobacteraceae bacterium]|nr:hypothetical protein [Desulfobacteraceae bacterium]